MSGTSITTDTDEQVVQIAAGLGKSESELRATLWERIAAADLPADIDAEAIYESVVGDIYEDAVNQGEESTAAARASATTDDSGGSLEAFGTGIQGRTDSTEQEIEAARRSEQLRARSSDDADDFSAGVQGEGATDRQIQAAREMLDEDDTPLEVFGTGLQDDTSADEYREREEEIKKMSEAFARAMDDSESED